MIRISVKSHKQLYIILEVKEAESLKYDKPLKSFCLGLLVLLPSAFEFTEVFIVM